jgi:hypothetical protein
VYGDGKEKKGLPTCNVVYEYAFFFKWSEVKWSEGKWVTVNG